MTEAHHTTEPTSRAASPAPLTNHVFVPVARGRALARSSVWLAPALVQALILWHVLADLQIHKTGSGSTMVAMAKIALLVPFAVAGAAMLVVGLRWLLLTLWPGRVGITADAHSLRLALGPFGRHIYDVNRLEAKYLFELSVDIVESGFEALLPDDEQVDNFLPRLLHPDAKTPINRSIMRFACGTEAEVARALRPMIAQWRGENATAENAV